MRYAAGTDEQGGRIEVADPLAERFTVIMREAGADPAALARGFLSLPRCSAATCRRCAFVAEVTDRWRQLIDLGARATVAEIIARSVRPRARRRRSKT